MVAATVRGASGRTWVRRPAERRTELLDAAERLFAEQGVQATTVSDITRAAGVSKGSFYVYFASRGELMEALNARLRDELFGVLDDVLATLVEHAAGAMADDRPIDIGPARLVELLDMSVERMVHALLARRDLIEVWSREPALAGGSAQWLGRFVDRLAPWMNEKGSRVVACVDPTTTALLVVHGIFGTVLHAVLLDQPIDEEVLAASAKELAARAFGLS